MSSERPRIEVYQAADGWRWRLKAENGEIVATGEAYTTKQGAERGVDTFRRCAAEVRVSPVD